VARATVEVEGRVVGRIELGMVVLLGVAKGDEDSDARIWPTSSSPSAYLPTSAEK